MPDRADIAGILLVIVGTIIFTFLQAFVPNTFSAGVPQALAFLTLTIPTFSYAAYWAFSIRRALAVRLYRRQAFGMGVIVLAFWSTIAIYIALSGLLSLPLYSALSTLSWFIMLPTIFYWIDASVVASRRSDPLLRDVFYWSKLRVLLWLANIIVVGAMFATLGYAEITGNASLLGQLVNGNFDLEILSIAYQYPSTLVLLSGIIFLPAIAYRAKWDRLLRRHFAWFAVFAALFFGIISGNTPPLIGPLIFLAAGFSLYESAKSLVPLNRVSLSDSG